MILHRTEIADVCLKVYSSPWQPEFYDWAFTYPRHIDRFNPTPAVSKQQPATNPVPDHPAIDIMITHGPPKNILDATYYGDESVGCDHLRRAVARCRPRLHCFGHIHEGWGAQRLNWEKRKIENIEAKKEELLQQRSCYVDVSQDSGNGLVWGEETLFVNASIMDVHYKPINAPFVVDLDLPKREEVVP